MEDRPIAMVLSLGTLWLGVAERIIAAGVGLGRSRQVSGYSPTAALSVRTAA